LLLARDRLGIKPLYYSFNGNVLVFASEIKAIMQEPSVPATVSNRAIYSYFRTMAVRHPDTIFEAVKKLEPASIILLNKSGLKKIKYWSIPQQINSYENQNTLIDIVETKLKKTVSEHLLSDIPLGSFLSGGVDSSLITSMAVESSAYQKMNSFCVSFTNHPRIDESNYADAVSKVLNTTHHKYSIPINEIENHLDNICWHADEPFAVSSSIPLYFLSQYTSQFTRVVLTGDGGDEIMAGYPRHTMLLPARKMSGYVPHSIKLKAQKILFLLQKKTQVSRRSSYLIKLNAFLEQLLMTDATFYVRIVSVLTRSQACSIMNKESYHKYFQFIDESIEAKAESYWQEYSENDDINRKLYVDLNTSLLDEMLIKVDRMTMAFGLEARVPMLDHEFVELCFSIPGQYKTDSKYGGKCILRRILEKRLPQQISMRPKQGFVVPLDHWLSGKLLDYINDQVYSTCQKSLDFLNIEYLKKCLAEHRSGTRMHSNLLYEVLVWMIWNNKVEPRMRSR
jgi:asparagine synthase (glutamine-hydrolysing)